MFFPRDKCDIFYTLATFLQQKVIQYIQKRKLTYLRKGKDQSHKGGGFFNVSWSLCRDTSFLIKHPINIRFFK